MRDHEVHYLPFGSAVATSTIATGQPHRLNAAMRMDRFLTGAVLDEVGTGAQPNKH